MGLVGDYMILNNHGWSLQQMILCSAIILIAFFFVIFFSMQLMNTFGETFKESVTGNVTYATIERNLEQGARAYINEYYMQEIGRGTITILKENLIYYDILNENDFVTTEKDVCDGYALVRKYSDNTLKVEPYITCSHYITKDFQEWRIGEINE